MIRLIKSLFGKHQVEKDTGESAPVTADSSWYYANNLERMVLAKNPLTFSNCTPHNVRELYRIFFGEARATIYAATCDFMNSQLGAPAVMFALQAAAARGVRVHIIGRNLPPDTPPWCSMWHVPGDGPLQGQLTEYVVVDSIRYRVAGGSIAGTACCYAPDLARPLEQRAGELIARIQQMESKCPQPVSSSTTGTSAV
jgi:hypothetical protein